MNGTCLEFEKPIRDAISRIRFAPYSNNLLISSWDSTLRLYDVDGSVLRLEAQSEAAPLDCCFQNESVAFSAGSDGFVRRYDLHSGTTSTIGNHDDIATSIGYSDETSQVISAGLDKEIVFWDTRTAEAVAYLRNLGAEVESMSLSGSNLMVAIGASIYMYDLRNLDKPVQSEDSHVGIQIRCVSSSPYSKGYAVGSVDGRVAVEICHPSNPNDIRYMFRCHPKSKDGRYHLASVNDIVFNPLIRGAFVTGDNEGYVTAWDIRSRRRIFELPRYQNSVASLSYNHEGQLLAVASSYTYQEAKEIIKGLILFMCTLAVTEKSFLKYSYTELMTATLDQCLPEVRVGIDCTRYYADEPRWCLCETDFICIGPWSCNPLIANRRNLHDQVNNVGGPRNVTPATDLGEPISVIQS